MPDISSANQSYWDALAAGWKKLRDQDQLWRRIPQQPELAFEGEALSMIRTNLGDLHGKRACVIGSGDNYLAFALAGMGAAVTSTDLSARQLDIARERAEELKLGIQFLQADAAKLEGLSSDLYDLVCSSNGFFVWIAEPALVFQQVCRILKPGGYYIFYDIHPFLRPWKNQMALEMEKPYADTGPYQYEENGQTSYEFHWRLSDLLNPLLESGLLLRQVAESPAKDARFWEGHSYEKGRDKNLLDWRVNPRAGLPVWLSVAAQKPF